MKSNYSLVTLITLFCLLISSTALAELSSAKPEDVGLSSERLNKISNTLKAHVEKGLPGRLLDYKFLFSVEGLVLIRLYFDWRNPDPLAVMELTC